MLTDLQQEIRDQLAVVQHFEDKMSQCRFDMCDFHAMAELSDDDVQKEAYLSDKKRARERLKTYGTAHARAAQELLRLEERKNRTKHPRYRKLG